jgi:hypothetical protein
VRWPRVSSANEAGPGEHQARQQSPHRWRRRWGVIVFALGMSVQVLDLPLAAKPALDVPHLSIYDGLQQFASRHALLFLAGPMLNLVLLCTYARVEAIAKVCQGRSLKFQVGGMITNCRRTIVE